jgi:hypothetical protein
MRRIATFLNPCLLMIAPTALLAAMGSGPAAESEISAAALLADLEVAREAYTTLHPGLYRYNTPPQIEARFDQLATRFADGSNLREAYLAFSEVLAAIRCGHTYANFWNQSEDVQQQLFGGADKVPFTFRILGDRLIVTGSATDDTRVRPGTQILAIDGVATGDLIDQLLELVHADGSADHQRRFELQVTGVGDFEIFDVFQPLVHPPTAGRYRFSAIDSDSGEPFEFTAEGLTRERRKTLLEERHGPLASTPDELWRFELLDETTAYLKAGSFVTWKMELDWRGFLNDAFDILQERSVDHLILDVRGNSGGDDEVLVALFGHLLRQPISLPPIRELMLYETVSAHLVPFLDTWDRSFLDRTGTVRPTGDGFYTWKDASLEPRTIPGSATAFSGELFLLVDPSNSSATFTLARILKDVGRATLVGQPTGGNRRGINGGQMFFLRLPNSGLEMDIPLIGYYPLELQPDGGVLPDVVVVPSIDEIAQGVDAVLEATLRLIADKRSSEESTFRPRGDAIPTMGTR